MKNKDDKNKEKILDLTLNDKSHKNDTLKSSNTLKIKEDFSINENDNKEEFSLKTKTDFCEGKF